MIRIVSATGCVAVDDRLRGMTMPAAPGLELANDGDWLIATSKNSSAELNIGGSRFKLPPQSYIRLRPDRRTWWAKHGIHADDVKLLVGKLWAMIEQEHLGEELVSPNAVVGVRG